MAFDVPQKIPFETSSPLENGQSLPHLDLMIEAYGMLNTEKSNAVLICHILSGNHHIAGRYSAGGRYLDWWDSMAGPSKPISTERFFMVGLSNLGGCYSSTGPLPRNPETSRDYDTDFPLVTVKDWVRSQALLMDYLGIRQWAAVVSGSLDDMQALQWAISHPECVRHALAIASTPKLSTRSIAPNDVARQAIPVDLDFNEGYYACQGRTPTRGLRTARIMGYITYPVEDGSSKKFGRDLRPDGYQYGYDVEFEVESYLRYQGNEFAGQLDANTYLSVTKALDYLDPATGFDDDLTRALQDAQVRFFVTGFSPDRRFSPERSKESAGALITAAKPVQYIEIKSSHGHDAFLIGDEVYTHAICTYMNNVHRELRS